MSSGSMASKRPHENAANPGVEGPELKRMRADGVEWLGAQLERDKEFWYDDGSVVLVARGVGFKTYKGILSDHSPVFSDMFTIPQPTERSVEEQSHGCPVVHLDDSPVDLRHILRAALPRKLTMDSPANGPHCPTFHMISAYARLGHKYQMDDLLEYALGYLKDYYAVDLEKWTSISPQLPTFDLEHAIGVINIARLTNCTSILPAAFSDCCALPVDELMRGMKREDGTVEKLSDDDFARCIQGRIRIMEASAGCMVKTFSPVDLEPCASSAVCLYNMRRILNGIARVPMYVADGHPFTRSWHKLWKGGEQRGVCEDCWSVLQDRFREERRTMWERLPQFFDIDVGGWSDVCGNGREK